MCTCAAVLLRRICAALVGAVCGTVSWKFDLEKSNGRSAVAAGVWAPVPHGVESSSRSAAYPVGWYIPNNVELVRLRKLRFLEGVLVPSMELFGAWRDVGIVGLVPGVDGSEGGGEESSNGRLGFGLSIGKSSSSLSSLSWGIGWLIVGFRSSGGTGVFNLGLGMGTRCHEQS